MKLALVLAVMILMSSVAWAGDKEELQYQNMNLRIQNLSLQIQMIINERTEIVKEMQKKGYVFDQQGNFTRPKVEEPKKQDKK